MAIQPIQLPHGMGLGAGIEGLTRSLGDLSDWQRQRRLDQQAQEERQRAGFQDAWMKAQSLMHKGDFDGAQMILAPYSGDVQVSRQEIAPSMPQSTAGPPPQGGAPTPDGIEFGGTEYKGADLDQVAEIAGSQPANPIIAARQAQVAQEQAQNAKRYRTLLRGTGPGGQQFTIDPEAQREARIGRLDQIFGQSQDPIVQKYYPQLRPALAASERDTDPTDVLRYFEQMREQEARGEATKAAELEKERIYQRNKTDEAERDARNFGQSKELAHIAAAAARIRQNHVTPEKDQALDVPDLAGGLVKVRTGEAADKLRDAQGATVGVTDAIGRLGDHVTRFGREGNIPMSKTSADRTALIDDVTSYLTTLYNTGVLSKEEYERYVSKLNTGVRGGEATASGLQIMADGLRARFNSRLKAHARGAAPSGGQPVARPDAAPVKPNKVLDARAVQAARDEMEQ